MQFRSIRLLDQVLGRLLLLTLSPLCRLMAGLMSSHYPERKKIISFIKLHGGGSLLIAMPDIVGLREAYPSACFTLICTIETQKYAEIMGVFDNYITINPSNMFTLLITGLGSLARSFRHSVCVDLEPHSFLAAVFTLLTFSTRRLGFVKSNEQYRALAYTQALYFNPFAPIYAFYDQMACLLGAKPVTMEECSKKLGGASGFREPATARKRPAIYLSAFCSNFAPERMMPSDLWPKLLAKHYEGGPMTLLIGGGEDDKLACDALINVLAKAFPRADILNLCGRRTLYQAVEDIASADAFWGIDSGPLHVARLLGKPCFSFWGPTDPRHRLRAFDGLEEKTFYLNFACSPCIDSVERSPCNGNNLCMQTFLDPPLTTPPISIKI